MPIRQKRPSKGTSPPATGGKLPSIGSIVSKVIKAYVGGVAGAAAGAVASGAASGASASSAGLASATGTGTGVGVGGAATGGVGSSLGSTFGTLVGNTIKGGGSSALTSLGTHAVAKGVGQNAVKGADIVSNLIGGTSRASTDVRNNPDLAAPTITKPNFLQTFITGGDALTNYYKNTSDVAMTKWQNALQLERDRILEDYANGRIDKEAGIRSLAVIEDEKNKQEAATLLNQRATTAATNAQEGKVAENQGIFSRHIDAAAKAQESLVPEISRTGAQERIAGSERNIAGNEFAKRQAELGRGYLDREQGAKDFQEGYGAELRKPTFNEALATQELLQPKAVYPGLNIGYDINGIPRSREMVPPVEGIFPPQTRDPRGVMPPAYRPTGPIITKPIQTAPLTNLDQSVFPSYGPLQSPPSMATPPDIGTNNENTPLTGIRQSTLVNQPQKRTAFEMYGAGQNTDLSAIYNALKNLGLTEWLKKKTKQPTF